MKVLIAAALWMALIARAGAAETAPPPQPAAPPAQVLISVPDQRLAIVRDGELVARFPVSTSRFGTGDKFWSYKTPLGELKVCDKIGGNLPPGTVIRHRSATGEVLPVNAPGRDPIVTRVIWLDGLEAQNKNARSRGIYIHGTPQERTIGTPTSWGCIRMRSQDVIKVFDEVPVGTVVSIIPSKLPHMHKYEPPKEQPAPVPPAENAKPPEPESIGETAIAAAKVPAPAKPAANVEKLAAKPVEKPVAKPAENVAQTPASSLPPASPLPPVGEGPDRGTGWAWHALKGSFLLATLPGGEADKADDHRKKATQ